MENIDFKKYIFGIFLISREGNNFSFCLLEIVMGNTLTLVSAVSDGYSSQVEQFHVIITSSSPFTLMKTRPYFPLSPPTFSGRLFIMSTKAFLVMKWSCSLYFLALYLVGKGSVPPGETVITPWRYVTESALTLLLLLLSFGIMATEIFQLNIEQDI